MSLSKRVTDTQAVVELMNSVFRHSESGPLRAEAVLRNCRAQVCLYSPFVRLKFMFLRPNPLVFYWRPRPTLIEALLFETLVLFSFFQFFYRKQFLSIRTFTLNCCQVSNSKVKEIETRTNLFTFRFQILELSESMALIRTACTRVVYCYAAHGRPESSSCSFKARHSSCAECPQRVLSPHPLERRAVGSPSSRLYVTTDPCVSDVALGLTLSPLFHRPGLWRKVSTAWQGS